MDKTSLRTQQRASRAARSAAARSAAAKAVAERVLAMPEVQGAARVLCYVSVRYEVSTAQILAALGPRAAVPEVLPERRLQARQWVQPAAGRYGIPTSTGPAVDDVTVCLCPGLGFDADGGRLGKGGGYYDRWLAAHPAVLPIGLCFDADVLPEVPQDAHDRRVAVVVTPKRTLRTGVPVVAGAWIRDGRVLAAQRGPDRAQAGLWELPGGKVEPTETPQAALVRELSEELSATVQVHEALSEASHQYPRGPIHLALWRVSCADEPVATEHTALRWLDRTALHSVAWAPADQPLLSAVDAALERSPC